MNHNLRALRQLAPTCLGIAFSLLMLIATPALSSSVPWSGVTQEEQPRRSRG